jgi:hypothetical protein
MARMAAEQRATLSRARTIALVGCPWQCALPSAILRPILAHLVAPTSYAVAMVCRSWSMWAAAAGSAGLHILDKLVLARWYRMPDRLSRHLMTAISMRSFDLAALRAMAPQLTNLSMIGQPGEHARPDAVPRFTALTSFALTYQAPRAPHHGATADPVVLALPAGVRAMQLWAAGWTAVVPISCESVMPLEWLELRGSIALGMAAASLASLQYLRLVAVDRWCPRGVGDLLPACARLQTLIGVVLDKELDIKAIAACASLTELSVLHAADPKLVNDSWSVLAPLSRLTHLTLPPSCVAPTAMPYSVYGGGLSSLADIPSLRLLHLRTGLPALATAVHQQLILHTAYICARIPDLRVAVIHSKPMAAPPAAPPTALVLVA